MLCSILALGILSCDPSTPHELSPSVAEANTGPAGASGGSSSNVVDFGSIHNCGLVFLQSTESLSETNPPSTWLDLQALVDHLYSNCSLPTLSSGEVADIEQLILASPLESQYPNEFVTNLIEYTLEVRPEDSLLINKYLAYWSLIMEGENPTALQDFYETEILGGNWNSFQEEVVANSHEVLLASNAYWNETNEILWITPEPNSDAIGTAIFGILAFEFGVAAPIVGAIAGQIVSYAVGGLVENWGNW